MTSERQILFVDDDEEDHFIMLHYFKDLAVYLPTTFPKKAFNSE